MDQKQTCMPGGSSRVQERCRYECLLGLPSDCSFGASNLADLLKSHGTVTIQKREPVLKTHSVFAQIFVKFK